MRNKDLNHQIVSNLNVFADSAVMSLRVAPNLRRTPSASSFIFILLHDRTMNKAKYLFKYLVDTPRYCRIIALNRLCRPLTVFRWYTLS